MTPVEDADGTASVAPRPQTTKAYLDRYRQLVRAAANAMGKPPSLAEFTDWIIDVKRKTWKASAWRQNRAAVRAGLAAECAADPRLCPQIEAAMARFDTTRPDPPVQAPLRTSAAKAKRFKGNDLLRIRHAALASKSPNGPTLAAMLLATDAAGLRPIEWRSAHFGRSSSADFRWELKVRNAKHDVARAHGEFRTLRWNDLGSETISAIEATIGFARRAGSDASYDKAVKTLEGLMRQLTRALFPRRLRRPTLYTARHESIARWKAHYVEGQPTSEGRLHGLAIVAALSGHACDTTATMHYGRPRRSERGGGGVSIPAPEPTEVARVRRRMQHSLARLAGLKPPSKGYRP